MAIVNDERRKLIAEIKLQCENINNRIEELLTQYSVDDLKTIKETMKYDNERFQYRLNNQEITILNTKDNSLKMIVTQENGETTQVYDGDKRSSMVISGDDGVMVIQTNKEVGKTAMRFNSDEEEMYFDENGASILISDDVSSLDLEIDGNKIKSNFNVDDNVSLSLNGKIKNGKITGKLKGIDLEYKEEFKKLGKNDFEDKAEYKYAKNAGVLKAEFKEGEIKNFEARDFVDGYSPDGSHGHYVAKKDKNGNMHIRLEEGEDVLEGVNILEEENVAPIKGFIKSNLEDSNVIEENVVEPENKEIEAENVNSKERVVEPVNEMANEESDVTEKETIIKVTPYWGYSKGDGSGVNIYARYNKLEVHNVYIKDTGDTIRYSVLGDSDGNNLLHGALIYQDKDGNVIKDKCKVYDLGDEVNLDGKNVMLHASDRRAFCRVDGKYLGPRISIREDDKSRTIGLDVYDGNGNLMHPSKNCSFMYIEEESNLERENLKIDMRGMQAEDKPSVESYSRLNDRIDERNNLSKPKNMVGQMVGAFER